MNQAFASGNVETLPLAAKDDQAAWMVKAAIRRRVVY
jgi:hypothetical protein